MRTSYIAVAISLMLLAGCSGLILREDDSGLETTGKVAARVLLCPMTVCWSEAGIAQARREEEQRVHEADYRHWLSTLSPEQPHEYALEQARIQAAGMALFGLGITGGPFRLPPPQPAVQPSRTAPPVSCTSNRVGQSIYTNCY